MPGSMHVHMTATVTGVVARVKLCDLGHMSASDSHVYVVGNIRSTGKGP